MFEDVGSVKDQLEKQPCEDAISRKAVINALFYASDNNCDVVLITELMNRINSLPSVTPTTENDKFIEFLWNTINPNEMEQYLAMYHSEEEKRMDDLISRQAVLDTLDKHKYSNEFCEEHHIDWSINLGMAHIAVNELPSVQPKQKIGKWIKKMVRGSEELYCSNCGDGIDVIYEYNFCPNCGAKMEEGE